ncbi:MAG TPA: hypothetical protein PK536_03180 [Ignavibacteria bacterium]|nr:hypothetical protein [Bacteroidota bacterium]HRI84430.1 hypothetical protein [Ignavibacteria bacterium]HRJ98676.1 hypothetical protein [Ignavibacteria bacterium]
MRISVKIKELLTYAEITDKWENSNKDINAAKLLTLRQLEKFEEVISDDESWKKLVEIFNSGRETDAWLALDWPDGFDELILCLPMCRYVDFECRECKIGKRQENNSCANDYSLFGYISELLKVSDRNGLQNHITSVKKILLLENYKWNISEKKLELINFK